MARGYLPRGASTLLPWGRGERGSAISHLLTLLAGGVIGALGVWWVLVGAPAQSARGTAATASALNESASARAAGGAIARDLAPVAEISVARRNGSSERSAGIALQRPDGRSGILVPLEMLVDAQAVVINLGGGNALALGQVLSIAPQAGLALLSTTQPLHLDRAFRPAQDGSLHLGRQLELHGRGGQRQAGWIDSAAQRNPAGVYWYALSEQLQSIASPAAVVDASGALLGVAVPAPERMPATATGGPARAALDLQALAPLLDEGTGALAPLGDFVDAFFATDDTGRLLRTRHAAERGDWQMVLRAGSDLANLGYPIGDAARPLLEEAFQVTIADALAGNGGARMAQQLLDQGAALLGWSAPRRLLSARLARSLGDIDGALAQLNQAQLEAQGTPRTQDALREASRQLLDDILRSGSLGEEHAIALLRGQLAVDEGYAHYHAALGRLLFDAGSYRDALPSLYRARALDGARYDGEFSQLIALAEERLYAPDVTVVPVQSQGSTLFVTGSIPGIPGTYRFILDTGASITAIAPRVAAALPGLRSRGSVRLSTANGEVDAPLVTLPSLDVAGARVAQLDVVVLDSLDRYDGLLGLSFLDHFNMELDRNRNEMILRLR